MFETDGGAPRKQHGFAQNALCESVSNRGDKPKILAGYIATFSQFVEPDVPIGTQMWVIVPTALILTTLSYTGYCALGAHLGAAHLITSLISGSNAYWQHVLSHTEYCLDWLLR